MMVETVLDFGEIFAICSFLGGGCGDGGRRRDVACGRDVACNVSTLSSPFKINIPCTWFGMTTNSPKSISFAWFLISCQQISAITPVGDNFIFPCEISPKKHSLSLVQMVIK